MDVLLSAAGSGLWFIIGALVAGVFEIFRERHKLGHVRRFISESAQVHIICSSVQTPNSRQGEQSETPVPEMTSEGKEHAEFMRAQPDNVLFSPTAEGAAVARLYLALHKAAKWRKKLCRKEFRVDLLSEQNFSPMDSRDPFVCVGGPSLNAVSKQLIGGCLPQFAISYPGHEVQIGDTLWREPGRRDGRLVEDYGFTLIGKTPLGTPFIIVWGVYAFGTLIATRAYLENWKKFDRGERKKLKEREGLFLVSHGRVVGFQVVDPIQPVRPQPQIMVIDIT
ncbi:hypothetical protein ACFY04_43560 [Streptomyces sp. NPDC001549]|uniref:hypothetical protein n=1 Tax=Streptomyces sp. NPDC001549 TaxID=3364586 RepID=UPI0036A43322